MVLAINGGIFIFKDICTFHGVNIGASRKVDPFLILGEQAYIQYYWHFWQLICNKVTLLISEVIINFIKLTWQTLSTGIIMTQKADKGSCWRAFSGRVVYTPCAFGAVVSHQESKILDMQLGWGKLYLYTILQFYVAN